MIEEIKIKGLLSFGWEKTCLDLKPLNVFIGPNGTGKSNLIEVLRILKSAPSDLHIPFRKGGANEWIHKGNHSNKIASIEINFKLPNKRDLVIYKIDFSCHESDPFMTIEKEILYSPPRHSETKPYIYFRVENGEGVINTVEKKERKLVRETFDPRQSVLSQRLDPDQYPEVTQTAGLFKKISIYSDWIFGQENSLRKSQKTSDRTDFLEPNFNNFGLVLNSLRKDVKTKKLILKYLQNVFENIHDLDIAVASDSTNLFLQEGEFNFPAVRLSDGTLRWMCLLVILLNPSPPPLICLEEPELGLHPDIVVMLADLLQEVSSKTTLLVTTHSELLIDALSENPEAVIVTEKAEGSTQLNRLDADELSQWLKEYSLGALWRSGKLGGNRW